MCSKKQEWDWRKLAQLCETIHIKVYDKRVPFASIPEFDSLSDALDTLPEEPGAIVWQEAMAILNEGKGLVDIAIKHRLAECQLIERLHEIVEHDSPDPDTVEVMLHRRGTSDLEQRKQIVNALRATPKKGAKR